MIHNFFKNEQGLHVRLHEIDAFLYIHIHVSTEISLLYVNKYIHVCLYVLSLYVYPDIPKMRVCSGGILCLYLRMCIRR